MKKHYRSKLALLLSLLFVFNSMFSSVNALTADELSAGVMSTDTPAADAPTAVTPTADAPPANTPAAEAPATAVTPSAITPTAEAAVTDSLSADKSSEAALSANALSLTANNTVLPPSNLAFQLTSPDDVKLTWNSVFGSTGYNIYGITEGQLKLLATTTATTYTFNNLAEGSYTYVVSTISTDGESGPCAPITADVVYPDMTAPATLTNTFQNVNDIVLNWSASQYAETYNIYTISEDGQKTLLTSVTGRTYTIPNASEGNYTYGVSAVNSMYGESPISAALQVNVVFPIMAPPGSAAYKIQNGNDVVLTWSSASYANSYKIYELVDDQKVLKTTVTSATATLSGVPAGNHNYVIYSVSTRFGESSEGRQVSLNVAEQTMQAPPNLTYTLANGTDVTLKWGTVTYATAYRVYQVLDGQKVLKSTVTATTAAYTSLPAGTYVYEVHSYSDRFGESPEGSQITIDTGAVQMAPPGNFTYTINNGNDIVLSWDSVPNTTNYKVYLVSNGQKVLKSTLAGTTVTYTNMVAGNYSYEIHSYSTTFGESAEGSQLAINLTYPAMQPPANLVEIIKNATDFSLNWDAASYATSYKVYQIVNSQKVLKSTVTGTTVAYTNMVPGDYSFEVHSYSARFGESAEGTALVVTMNGQTMEAPANLTYTAANINDITLKWAAAQYATSYKIYQIVDGQSVLKTTATTTTVTFTNMPSGDYHYVVTSVSSLLGESPSGAEITFTLTLPVMSAPDSLTYKIQNTNSIVLSWAASSNANSYKVYEVVDGKEVLKTTVTTLTATIANVPAGDHTYSVHSVSARFGESQEGSKISLSLNQQILAPADLTYSIANGNDITLKWTAAAYATSYNIYQIVEGQKVLKKTITAVSNTFTNMPAGDYDYVVTSVSSVFGESSNQSEVTFALSLPVMAAPDNFAYKIQNINSVVLSWAASSYANSYKVYEVIEGKEVLKTTVATLTTTIANLAAGDHTYSVHSVSTRFGESSEGSKVSLTLSQQMLPPADLSYTIANGNDITLKWTAASSASSYQVYQLVDGQKVLKKTVTTTSVTFANMTAGDYDYVVTSVSGVFGESANGSEVIFSLVLPTMAAPDKLAGKIQSANNIVLTWAASSYANSYKVYEVVNDQEVLKTTVSTLTATITNVSAGNHTYSVHSVSTRFGESQQGSQVSLNVYQQMLPPANLTYSITNGNDITLKWTAAAYANSYQIYQVSNGEKVLKKTVTTASAAFTNMPGGNYDYIVTSVSSIFGESADGSEITFNLVLPVMAAPGNFTQSIANGNDITIKWSAVTYATAYKVYQVIDGQKSLLKTLTGTTLTFANMPSGDYTYEVDSYCDRFGESPVGSTINFTLTWPVVQAPVLNDSITNVNNITFSWPAVTWANEYRFYQVTEDSRKLLYSGTALNYKLYNLPEGTFNYEVTAYNTRFGESTSSNRITENIIYPEMQAPTASIKLLNSTTALIYWNFVTYANGYNVYELVDDKPVLLTENLNNLSYQTDNLSYLDHKFYVTSYSNSFGESQPSNTVIAKLDTEAPVTISDAPAGWVNQSPLTVTLSASDSKTSVVKTYYSINGSEYSEGTSFTVDKEGVNKISFYSVDAVGNIETAKSAEVKIDKAAPVTTAKVLENWSGEDLTVALTAADAQSGIAKTFYSIDDSEYLEGSSFTVKDDGIHKISFYSVDAAGNIETAKAAEVKIDKTAPVTTADVPENWSGEDLTVALTATDAQSGIAKTFYSIDGSQYYEGSSFTVKDDGIHKISFYSVDVAGNIETAKTAEVKIDKTAPVTTANVPEDWSGEDLTVALTAADAQSGIAKTFYSIDDSEYLEGSSFTVKDDGIHKISFYSVDAAGNIETAKTAEVKIDKTAPVTTTNVPKNWSGEDLAVALTATDAQSGIAKTFYSIDGSQYYEGSSFTVKDDGIHKISFYSVDVAGNIETAKTAEVKIDKTAPVTTANVPEDWSGEDLTVALTATDAQSGVAKTFYSIDGSQYSESSSFTVKNDGMHKISFYSVDAAGNIEAAKTAEVKIDKAAPVTTAKVPKNWSGEDLTVALTAADAQSGIAKTFYSIDDSEYLEGSSFTVKDDGIHKISFYSVDAAGNIEAAKTAEVKIDKTAPVTTADVPENWSGEDLTVALTAADAQSGIAKTFYSIDDSEYLEGSSFTVKDDGIHKISFYSVDAAGNIETAKTAEVKIDKTAPVTTADVPENWSGKDLTITLTTADAQSGTANIFYSVDGSQYSEGSSITVKDDGIHKISFYSVDTVGNIETAKTAEVKIDKTAPVTTAEIKEDAIVLNAADSQSGVAKTFYSIDGSEYLEGSSFTIKDKQVNKISFYSVDAAGNIETVKTTQINSDKTAPVTTSNVPQSWSNQDVTVTLVPSDTQSGVAKTFYSVNGSEYSEGSSFTVKNDGISKISFYSVDKAGNIEDAKTAEVKVDKTAPVTTSSIKKNWCKCNMTVVLSAADSQSGVAKTFYSTDGTNYSQGTSFTIKDKNIYKISFYSVDAAGNIEAVKTTQVGCDKTAPVTTANAPQNWSNQDVTVTLVSSDAQSGVAKTFYSVNSSKYSEGSSFTVKDDGISKIKFYSVDNAGNIEMDKTAEVKIDRTAPVTTSSVKKSWCTNNMTVVLSATDSQSGVDKTFYSIDGTNYSQGTCFTVKNKGVFKISFYSVDAAGNIEAVKTAQVSCDKTAPVTTANVPQNWSNEDVTVTLVSTDAESGVAKTFYSVNGSEYSEGSSFTAKDDGISKISFYSVDAAGNIEAAKTAEVKIDRTAPVTTSSLKKNQCTGDTTVALFAADSQSGVDRTLYSIDGSSYSQGTSFTLKNKGTYKISFYSVDAAGNIEAANTTEVKVEKTVPVVTMDLDNEYRLGTFLKLSYTSANDVSGISCEKMIVYEPNETMGRVVKNNSWILFSRPGVYNITVTVTNADGLSSTLQKKVTVYIPVSIEVVPRVINSNTGIFTVQVCAPCGINYCGQGFDLSTATLNGVKALNSNCGYYIQSMFGQFNFDRSNFNWTPSKTPVEFRCYYNGYLIVGQTTVNVSK